MIFARQSQDCVNPFAGETLVYLNLFAGESLQDPPAKRLKDTRLTREKIDAILRLTREKPFESSLVKKMRITETIVVKSEKKVDIVFIAP